MPFLGLGGGRKGAAKKGNHQEVVDKEVHFWKQELEKACKEKNVWISKSASSQRQNEILCAELFLMQQSEASAKAQLALAKKQLSDAKATATAATSELAAAVAAMADADTDRLLSSSNMPHSGQRSGGVASQGGTSYYAGTIHSQGSSTVSSHQRMQMRYTLSDSDSEDPTPALAAMSLCPPVVQLQQRQQQQQQQQWRQSNGLAAVATSAAHNNKEAVEKVQHQLAAARVQLRGSELKAAGYEDELDTQATQIEALQNQLKLEAAKAEAYGHEASLLRHQLTAQCGINDETADEITHILSELSRLQQTNARMVSEVDMKNNMLQLLQNQLSELSSHFGSGQCSIELVGLASHPSQGTISSGTVDMFSGNKRLRASTANVSRALSPGGDDADVQFNGDDAEGTDIDLDSGTDQRLRASNVSVSKVLPKGEDAKVQYNDIDDNNNVSRMQPEADIADVPYNDDDNDSLSGVMSSKGDRCADVRYNRDDEGSYIDHDGVTDLYLDGLCDEGPPSGSDSNPSLSQMSRVPLLPGEEVESGPFQRPRSNAFCFVAGVKPFCDNEDNLGVLKADLILSGTLLSSAGEENDSQTPRLQHDCDDSLPLTPCSEFGQNGSHMASPAFANGAVDSSPASVSRNDVLIQSQEADRRSILIRSHDVFNILSCPPSPFPESSPARKEPQEQPSPLSERQSAAGGPGQAVDILQPIQVATPDLMLRSSRHSDSHCAHSPTTVSPLTSAATAAAAVFATTTAASSRASPPSPSAVGTASYRAVAPSPTLHRGGGSSGNGNNSRASAGSVPASYGGGRTNGNGMLIAAAGSAAFTAVGRSSNSTAAFAPAAGSAATSFCDGGTVGDDVIGMLNAESLTFPSTAATAFAAARAVALAAAGELPHAGAAAARPPAPKPRPRHIGGDVSSIVQQFQTVVSASPPVLLPKPASSGGVSALLRGSGGSDVGCSTSSVPALSASSTAHSYVRGNVGPNGPVGGFKR